MVLVIKPLVLIIRGQEVPEEVNVPANIELSAVITRADGTVEDLGVISAQYLDPEKQSRWDKIGQLLADKRIRTLNEKKEN